MTYVTGMQTNLLARHWQTIAYDAATGSERWVAVYNGPVVPVTDYNERSR